MTNAEEERTLTYIDGKWIEGNPPVIGPRTHASWLASVVFDGARAIRGKAPDLDLHCRRCIESALYMGLEPALTADEITRLAWEGIRQFPEESDLYVRPMFYGDEGFLIPETTRFLLCIHEAPLPEPTGFSATLSPFRRPSPESAPTLAKASCLYPNLARAIRDANAKGFDMAVMLDPAGDVAEFASSNLFFTQGGVIHTPAPNDCFLNGITRQRVIQLLRDDGHEIVERRVAYEDVLKADEIFATSNYSKVVPCTKIEDRKLEIGPVFKRARELYFEFARRD